MEFRWIGGPTFILKLGGFSILTDPMFSEGAQAFVMNGHPSTGEDNVPIARLAPLPPLDLDSITLVLISHLHSDHFDSEARRRLDKSLPIVAPLDHAESISAGEFENVFGLSWWHDAHWQRDGERVTVAAVPARHAHADELNQDLGVVNGYVIEYEGPTERFRCYWTGDTVWFEDLRQIKALTGKLDLLVPHLGAVGRDGPYGMMTLDAIEAVRMVELFSAERVVPIHHNTFSHYVEPISAFRSGLQGTPYEKTVTIIEEGDAVRL